MRHSDKLAESSASGSALRNVAAKFLHAKYKDVRIEQLIDGKKVDIICYEEKFGKRNTIYVEVKDYKKHLDKADVTNIIADYLSFLQNNSSTLLIVTRNGISSAADAQVRSHHQVCHQTIWELEGEAFDTLSYVEAQTDIIQSNGIVSYYQPQRAHHVDEKNKLSAKAAVFSLMEYALEWLDGSSSVDARPLAILGGYGAGKSSFAQMLFLKMSQKAIVEPSARRPILIKLGNVSRFSALDGLLGAMFTNQFVVTGYSYQRFLEFNRAGRFLILLDGFDEMKFAMSFADFKSQIKELADLIDGDARVVLLGRPTAFLSDSERLQILQGVRNVDGIHIEIPGWPKFREIEIDEFSKNEIKNFISTYSNFLKKTQNSVTNFKLERSNETQEIAIENMNLFTKPVHLKILCEIAFLSDLDISGLREKGGRWQLYYVFFTYLFERESSKNIRQGISDERRFRFLKELAYWLWGSKEGSVSFKSDHVPHNIYADLVTDNDERYDVLRELLVGSFIERKQGDNYYFAHRSFCEFLVAVYVLENPPEKTNHTLYSKIIKDGVQEFLNQKIDEIRKSNWVRTLPEQNCLVDVDYLSFLSNVSLATDRNSASSIWQPLLNILSQKVGQAEHIDNCIASMKSSHPISCAVLITFIAPGGIFNVPSELIPSQEIYIRVASALLENLFSMIREDSCHSRITVGDGRAALLLQIINGAIVGPHSSPSGRMIRFDWKKLTENAYRVLGNAEIEVVKIDQDVLSSITGMREYPAMSVASRITSAEPFRKCSEYFSPSGREQLSHIAVVGQVKRPPKKERA